MSLSYAWEDFATETSQKTCLSTKFIFKLSGIKAGVFSLV